MTAMIWMLLMMMYYDHSTCMYYGSVIEQAIERSSDRTIERSSDRVIGRSSDRPIELFSDRTIEIYVEQQK